MDLLRGSPESNDQGRQSMDPRMTRHRASREGVGLIARRSRSRAVTSPPILRTITAYHPAPERDRFSWGLPVRLARPVLIAMGAGLLTGMTVSFIVCLLRARTRVYPGVQQPVRVGEG